MAERKIVMSLPYKGELIPRARELRKESTKQEKHLWYDFLKDYPVRFQRQKTIKGVIADFYCAKAKLIIELDGRQHYSEQGKLYDNERSALLSEYGLTVLRFSNHAVDNDFESVCALVDATVNARV